jgi:hypothetical protein
MSFKTITGRRQDLEAIPVNPPTEYIGNRVYPSLNVMEKTGTIYYQTLTADSAAQTNRSAGTAPTGTVLASSSTTFSDTEGIKRYLVPKDEVKQIGGVEVSDKLGGTAAKRSVLRAIETAQAAALLSTTRYNAASDIGSAIIDGITAAAVAVKRYEGALAFVCSITFYRNLIAEAEIKALMARFVPGGLSAESILSLTPAAFKAMLQTLFAFQEVLVGDDDHWAISGKLDAAAVVKLPDPENFSHKLGPVLGKTALYLPDGAQPFEIESFYNEDAMANSYTAQSWYQVKEFNAAACKLVKGIGASS